MAGTLSDTGQRRLQTGGPPPITIEQGLALFDAATLAGEPFLVPLGPAAGAFRARGVVPPLLRGLVKGGRRAAAAASAGGAAGPARLTQPPAALDTDGQARLFPGLVGAEAAARLGHPPPPAHRPG